METLELNRNSFSSLIPAFCGLVVLFCCVLYFQSLLTVAASLFVLSIFFSLFLLASVNATFAIALVIFTLAFQPFLTLLISHDLGGTGIKILIATKEIAALGVLTNFLLLRRIDIVKADVFIISFITIFTIYLLASSTPLFVRLLSYREGFDLFLFYALGSFLTSKELKQVLKWTLVVSILVVLFGFVERYLFTSELWVFLGNNEYQLKKYSNLKLIDGFPVNWFVGVNDSSGFHFVRRIVGPMAEGTSFARFVSFISVVFVFNGFFRFDLPHHRLYWKLSGLITFVAILISYGKGGMAIFFLAIVIWLWDRSNKVFFWCLTVASLPFFLPKVYSLLEANILRHFAGLSMGILSALSKPFGNGLGSSGQLAVAFGDVDLESKVTESFVGGLGFQMGLIGIFFYSFFMIGISLFTFGVRNKVKEDSRKLAYVCISMLLGIFLTSFLANSAVSPVASAVPLILVGFYIRNYSSYEI